MPLFTFPENFTKNPFTTFPVILQKKGDIQTANNILSLVKVNKAQVVMPCIQRQPQDTEGFTKIDPTMKDLA